MLAFDHRQVLRDLLGSEHETIDVQRERFKDAKRLVVEALLEPRAEDVEGRVGALIDEEYGADAARLAKRGGVTLAMPVEASRTKSLEFQYGDQFAEHIDRFRPDIVKILVFHNPSDAPERAEEQIRKSRKISDWCIENRYPLMVEMLIKPTIEQLSRVGGNEHRFMEELHTELLRHSIEEYQNGGVEPALWKIAGLPRSSDYEKVVEQARSNGRHEVQCIVLGNGASLECVRSWLSSAAEVDGVSGFAVGRSIWLQPLHDYFFGGVSRDRTRARISDAFASLIEAFEGSV